jgi:hypothetical protein
MSIHRSLCIPLPLGRLSQRISRISTHSSGALYPGFSPTTLGPTISSGTHRYAVASPSEVGWVGGWRGDAIAFRFQSPPIEPCMRLSGSKLSARTSTPLAWLVTFLKAVLRSRTVGFPESGSDLGSARHLSGRGPAHRCGSLSADLHTPLVRMVCLPPRRGDRDTSQVVGDGRWVVHRPISLQKD